MMSCNLTSPLVIFCIAIFMAGCGGGNIDQESISPQADMDADVDGGVDVEVDGEDAADTESPDDEELDTELKVDPPVVDEEVNTAALKVLFIGNSYTSANNLPNLFSALADSKGHPVDTTIVAPGGFKFSDHAVSPSTLEAINAEEWDFVILQNQSQIPGWKPDAVTTYSLPHVEVLVDAINANNAESNIIYYVTWGRESGDKDNCDYYPVVCTFEGHTAALLEGYNIYQASTGGTLGLVGSAWQAVVNDSNFVLDAGDLWTADGSHPTLAGSYLSANVLFVAVFNASPNGANYTADLSAEQATYLQQIATEAMAEYNPDIDGDGIPTAGYTDNFEQGNLTQLDWVLTGDGDWTVTDEFAQDGVYSFASGEISGDQSTSVSIDVDVSDSSVSFWYRVDSEEDYDFLQFYIDDELVLNTSDKPVWTLFKTALAAGRHTLTWRYLKDSSDDEGADKAWVDNIIIWKDNCPLVANPDQADIDGDDLGDACDDDSDNDGVVDSEDAFPFDDTETVDTDGDNIGNNTDGDDDGDGLPDVYENAYAFLDPLFAGDAELDEDNDWHSNLVEYHAVTLPDDPASPFMFLDGFNGFYKVIADDGVASDYFGGSVALDGDTALVGATGTDISGAAYVYTRDGFGNWVQQAKLIAPGLTSGENFGYSVALHNGTAVIGNLRNSDFGRNSGAAYVFVHDGNGNWEFQKKLTPSSDNEIETRFGCSVAILDDTIIVGAYGDKFGTDFNKIGSAYIFVREGNDWSEEAKLVASDAVATNSFGNKVAIQEDRVIASSGGGVYLFTRDGDAVWTEQKKLNALDSVSAIAFSDSDIVYGSSFSERDSYRAGAVHVFSEHEEDGWQLTETLFSNDIQSLDKFGASVAISENILVVSNFPADGPKSVYIFEKGGDGLWVEQNRLDAGDALTSDSYGEKLAIDNDTVIISARLDDDNGENAGAVYFYTGLLSDVDLDGVKDAIDNCPVDSNPDQENSDGDSYGDICDASPGD